MRTLNICLGLLLSMTFLTSAAADEAAKKASGKVCPETLGSNFPFPSKIEVEVVSYDPATLTYEVIAVNLPDEGTPAASLEAIAKSIGEVRDDFEKIVKDPKSIVGNIYMTGGGLPTLTEEEVAARKGCVRGKN